MSSDKVKTEEVEKTLEQLKEMLEDFKDDPVIAEKIIRKIMSLQSILNFMKNKIDKQ